MWLPIWTFFGIKIGDQFITASSVSNEPKMTVIWKTIKVTLIHRIHIICYSGPDSVSGVSRESGKDLMVPTKSLSIYAIKMWIIESMKSMESAFQGVWGRLRMVWKNLILFLSLSFVHIWFYLVRSGSIDSSKLIKLLIGRIEHTSIHVP